MSTIKVDTLQTRAGSTAAVTGAGFVATDQIRGNTAANSVTVVGEGGTVTTNLQQGLAKAWVEGSDAAAPQDSFNIASGTDGGVGTYSYAIANDMSSIAYSINVCAHSVCVALTNDDSQTASVFTCDLFLKASLGDRGDRPNYSTIHGDLA